jgi:hypothetical protein
MRPSSAIEITLSFHSARSARTSYLSRLTADAGATLDCA